MIPAAERGENGYRSWPPDIVAQILAVRRALAIGFSLDELAKMLRAKRAGHPPCREVRALAGRKLEELDQRLGEMQALRSELAAVLADWDVRLAGMAQGSAAHLLDSLETGPASAPNPPIANFRKRKTQ